MPDWLHINETLLWWLVAFSAFTFVTSLVAVPWMLVRIPANYFMTETHAHPWADRHPVIRITIVVAKNLLGIILLAIGLALLVLPGQGILTLLAGLVFVDFPGKHKVLLRTISQPTVLKSVNWIRERAGREPLELPEKAGERVKG